MLQSNHRVASMIKDILDQAIQADTGLWHTSCRAQIFSMLRERVVQLSMDKYGAYALRAMLDFGTAEQRYDLVQRIVGEQGTGKFHMPLRDMMRDISGVFAVRTALEVSRTVQQYMSSALCNLLCNIVVTPKQSSLRHKIHFLKLKQDAFADWDLLNQHSMQPFLSIFAGPT